MTMDEMKMWIGAIGLVVVLMFMSIGITMMMR
jgi:hypothetical protein